MNDSKQVLYAQCTAKWPGGLQCSVPVFDVIHERPLCDEHARKKVDSVSKYVVSSMPVNPPKELKAIFKLSLWPLFCLFYSHNYVWKLLVLICKL